MQKLLLEKETKYTMIKTDDPHAQILLESAKMGNYYLHIDEVFEFSHDWSEVSNVFEISKVSDSEKFADADEDLMSSRNDDNGGPISESNESFEMIDQKINVLPLIKFMVLG